MGVIGSRSEPSSSALVNGYSALCACVAFLLLAAGVVLYLQCRPEAPAFLELLGIAGNPAQQACASNSLTGALPTLIHVAAFSLLTSALFAPSVRISIVSGASWAGINCLWEILCASGGESYRAPLRNLFAHPGLAAPAPVCTFDNADMVAAVAGATLATGLVAVVSGLRRRIMGADT